MTASILYRPINPEKRRTIGCWAPSSFRSAMEEVFGWPCVLTEKHVPQLKAMSATWEAPRESRAPNPYAQIVDLVEKHGAIEVWDEH